MLIGEIMTHEASRIPEEPHDVSRPMPHHEVPYVKIFFTLVLLTGVTVAMVSGVAVHGQIETAGDIQGLPIIEARRTDSLAPPNAASELRARPEQDRAKFTLNVQLDG